MSDKPKPAGTAFSSTLERTAVHGAESIGSPVARTANPLAKVVDISEVEMAEQQSCSYQSPSHRDEISYLGSAVK